jgi:hypothetical protein
MPIPTWWAEDEKKMAKNALNKREQRKNKPKK